MIKLLAAFVVLSVLFLLPLASYSSETSRPLRTKSSSKQLNPKKSHASALKAAQKGDFTQAVSLLSPFAAKPLKYPEIYADYLVFLAWDGKPRDAVELYEKLPDKFPRRPYLLRNMAKAYYDTQVPSMAALLYLEVLDKMPADEEAQKGLVQSLIESGEYARASEHVDAFLKNAPDSISLIEAKARLLARQAHERAVQAANGGNSKEAVSLLTSYIAEPLKYPEIYSDYLVFLVWDSRAREAIELYEKLPDQFPRRPYLLRNMAKAYHHTDNFPPAASLYEAALAQGPSDEEAQKGLIQSKARLLAGQEHDRAVKAAGEGNFKEALSLLVPYAAEPLKYPDIYADYLAFLVWDGRTKEAIELYEKLPGQFPRKPYLLRNMAKAYYDVNDDSKAASLYKSALEQAPSDDEARKGLVLSLMGANDLTQALDYLDLFLKDTPKSPFLGLNKARILVLQGRYVEGLKLYRAVAAEKGANREQVYRERDGLIESLSDEKRQAMAAALQDAAQKGDTAALPDHIHMLIVTGEYPAAVKAFESQDIKPDDYLLSRIAWAYFKTGNAQKATSLYNSVLASRPDYPPAGIGLAYCIASEGRGGEALKFLDGLIASDSKNLEARFARAFVFEKENQFWDAVHEYDSILEIARDNPTAKKLRLRALSDLGGSSLAMEGAEVAFPSDSELHRDIKGDMAVHFVKWDEPKEAIKLLEPQAQDKNYRRARFDLVEALARVDEMERVTTLYEEMVSEGITVPSWILSDVAGAYLYLEHPRKALDLYEVVIKSEPHSFDARMGRFYALQELREWDRAAKERDALDKETPELLGKAGNVRPNWPKTEVALAKGWLLAYEERLREADQFFSDMHAKASYNTNTRDGLAHVWFWRGWPRKALEEFRIIETIDPNHAMPRIGKADTLNSLAFKEQARKEAGDLLRAYPRNKHIQQLNRRFKVEEMREFDTNASFTREEGGYEQFRADMHFFQPVSLYSRLNGYVMAQKDRDKNSVKHYRRAGVGIDHVFNSSWRLRQQFSVNYDDGRDFGSFTELDFSPDDYWRFSAVYDSFITDVPLRARVFGTDAEKYELAAVYRQSEWRDFRLGLSRLDFSDGNRRSQVAFGYSQGLWVKNDWKARLMLNLYTSRNSSDDAPYFNPDKDWSLSATYLLENTRYRIYNRALVQRLYLTLGSYKQSGFSKRATGSIRYERAYDFSDTRALLLGASLSRNAYDGELTDSYRLDLSYIWRF